MKIGTSTIGMESARSYKASSVTYQRFEVKDYKSGLTQTGEGWGNLLGEEGLMGEGQSFVKTRSSNSEGEQGEGEQGSFATTDSMLSLQEKMSRLRGNYKLRSQEETHMETIRQQTIRYIFELLVALRRRNREGEQNEELDKLKELFQNPVDALFTENSGKQLTTYTALQYYQESEETSFSSTGRVVCEDGREIEFQISVQMSRSFEQLTTTQMSMRTPAQCVDPLVINLNGNIAEVSDQTFYFDIDSDGEEDLIHRLGSGSGYLALDKNDDGVINDGKELFGTQSGDGFADLAQYDTDGNGWIDENDPIWEKLRIWTTDEHGKDVLYTLAKAGVGALNLNRVSTDYASKMGDNTEKAYIRSSGVFLYENGNVGTLQHVDMVKYQKEA